MLMSWTLLVPAKTRRRCATSRPLPPHRGARRCACSGDAPRSAAQRKPAAEGRAGEGEAPAFPRRSAKRTRLLFFSSFLFFPFSRRTCSCIAMAAADFCSSAEKGEQRCSPLQSVSTQGGWERQERRLVEWRGGEGGKCSGPASALQKCAKMVGVLFHRRAPRAPARRSLRAAAAAPRHGATAPRAILTAMLVAALTVGSPWPRREREMGV